MIFSRTFPRFLMLQHAQQRSHDHTYHPPRSTLLLPTITMPLLVYAEHTKTVPLSTITMPLMVYVEPQIEPQIYYDWCM